MTPLICIHRDPEPNGPVPAILQQVVPKHKLRLDDPTGLEGTSMKLRVN